MNKRIIDFFLFFSILDVKPFMPMYFSCDIKGVLPHLTDEKNHNGFMGLYIFICAERGM